MSFVVAEDFASSTLKKEAEISSELILNFYRIGFKFSILPFQLLQIFLYTCLTPPSGRAV